MTGETYQSPLGTRYASRAMQELWGARRRAGLWRRLWLALAEEEKRLGVDIPDDAIAAMRAQLDTADLEAVREYENRFRHDVMAHVHHFGDQAPAARPFIHLGATSAFVTDNAELVLLRESLRALIGRTVATLHALRTFALEHRTVPTVAYTHFQPAQLTTVGKRATLWLQDFMLDAAAMRDAVRDMPFRGCKGTTGTQASYLDLFSGDHEKVRELDRRLAQAFGFETSLGVTGQTYTRKLDSRALDLLSQVAQSAAKMATDVRLLQHEGELLEPVEPEQIGSSAMPYKRNPMRCERICSLARYVIALGENTAYTSATQWLERTLDDSANRRMVLPEAFLGADAVLILAANVAGGLEVRPATTRRNVERVMPFMATERWLMLGVKAGGDRQDLHEVIRRESWAVSDAMEHGSENNLLDRLASHSGFANIDRATLQAELDPATFVGRSPEQVVEFTDGPLADVLDSLEQFTAEQAEITV
ncbi:MAG: adenylosuccinate lyase [Gemmatimonadetes bacterium]|nr:adenylosuccinate lyase [Gemmatimonadota bacterium]